MEARDSSAKIRLLPPDAPQGAPNEPKPKRRWVGPAAVIGGIATFALTIGLWSSATSSNDATTEAASEIPSLAAEPTTTTISPAPETPSATAASTTPLLDQVPDLAPELWLAGATTNPDGSMNVVTSIWNGNLPSPGATNVFDRTFPVRSSFAVNSRMLAVIGITRSDNIGTLYVGSNASLAPQFIGVNSYAWVHGDELEISFVGMSPGTDGAGLYHAAVAPSGALVDVRRVVEVAPEVRIAGAGEWGYLITGGTLIPSTTLLDLDGVPLRAVAGVVVDVTRDGVLVLSSAQSALTSALDSGASAADLGFLVEPVTIADWPFALLDIEFVQLPAPQSVSDALASGWTEFSPDGSMLIGTAPATEDRWTVRTATLDGGSGRVTSVVGATGYLGWSSDGNYVMYSTDGGMAFHDWDDGATHYTEFERDYELLAVGS